MLPSLQSSSTPLVHEKLSDQMADPSIVKMPSKKRDQRAQPEVYKSNSAERDNIDSRYQMATIQQGYVNYCLNPFYCVI